MSVSAITTSSSTQATLHAPTRRRGPTISVRKYGQNDFERFNEETARGSHLCVGSMSIGKVDIDVKYRWKEARWGVLGDDKSPGGVVYMDLTFKQPHGYWLESARVFVTLSEDSSTYALGKARRRDRVSSRMRNLINSDYDLQLTEHFGPQFLTGTKTVQTESKLNSFIPTVGAMGVVEIGGMGQSSATSKQRESRWIFKGTIRKPRDSDSFRTLEWELSENELDPNQSHKQDYQTAFAFEHNYRPVFMRVEVEGKLRSKAQNTKHSIQHKFLRFSSNPNKKDYSTLTHIDLSENRGFQKSLDPVATSLNMAMEMKNRLNPPMEMPDPTQAHFFQAPPSANQHQPILERTRRNLADTVHVLNQQLPAIEQRQQQSPAAPWNNSNKDNTQDEQQHDVDDALIRALKRRQATSKRPHATANLTAAHVALHERQKNRQQEEEDLDGGTEEEEEEESDAEDVQTTFTGSSSTLVNSGSGDRRSSFLSPEDPTGSSSPRPSRDHQDHYDPIAEIVNSSPTVRYILGLLVKFQSFLQGRKPPPPPVSHKKAKQKTDHDAGTRAHNSSQPVNLTAAAAGPPLKDDEEEEEEAPSRSRSNYLSMLDRTNIHHVYGWMVILMALVSFIVSIINVRYGSLGLVFDTAVYMVYVLGFWSLSWFIFSIIQNPLQSNATTRAPNQGREDKT